MVFTFYLNGFLDMHSTYGPMHNSHRPEQNHMLSALDQSAMSRLRPHLKFMYLALGKVLYEPDEVIQYVYFPTDCIVSMLYVMDDGDSAEIAVVGMEGMLGISHFMGGDSTPSRAVVQSAGGAYSLPSHVLKNECNRHGDLMQLMLRYTQALISQMAQTAVCNRHHTVDQQLCRWLLMSLDRLPGNRLVMTQELIANMLGVRREGVTVAAGKLQNHDVISYKRGKIEVLDRARLEAMCCECYAVIKKESDWLEKQYARYRRTRTALS